MLRRVVRRVRWAREKLPQVARASRALVRVLTERRNLLRAGKPVVWWVLTPPPRMPNAGDHAQAVAIERWLRESLGIQPLELDKDEYAWLARLLPRLVAPDEPILIHSGGNLGDRGIWSETLRRRIIHDYGANRVVSLPQTIYFSPTAVGRREAAESGRTYARHNHLDVVARDPISLELGSILFPDACRSVAPDPVLMLPRRQRYEQATGILMCIRDDNESALTSAQKSLLGTTVTGEDIEWADTDLAQGPDRDHRAAAVEKKIEQFARRRLVVTDRFHGAIFAFIANTPCLVLESVDHKIRGGMYWLQGCASMRLLHGPEEVQAQVSEWLANPPSCDCRDTEGVLSEAFIELESLVRTRIKESATSARSV